MYVCIVYVCVLLACNRKKTHRKYSNVFLQGKNVIRFLKLLERDTFKFLFK